MKSRAKLFLTCAACAFVVSAGASISTALAADAAAPVKDMPAADPIPFWWFHGTVEAGGRIFLNNPQRDGVASQGGKSLAKYYEYSTVKPGPFSNIWLSTGSRDGLYQIDIGGKNIGYSDQNYYLEASKAGEQYFNFDWDQTPHVYSTSARTLYNGVGTNALTLPAGVGTSLFNAAGAGGDPLANADAANVKSIIDGSVHQTDIGIRRNTASVEYRWTPTDSWDIKAHYLNMHRTGTQVDGVVMSGSENGVRTDVPAPVNDTTQNFGLNGEYAGTSPWGKKFNFKLAYNGSVYTDRYDSYTVQNPFCQDSPPGACPNAGDGDLESFNFARMSLPPSNQANAITATLGADLPSKSRYMGTLSYTMMRQNQDFLPFTINPNLGPSPTGAPWNSTAALPGSSLNGAINTLLSNNVVTTQITPDLKSKLSYRYYNYDNNTPMIFFPNWVGVDIAPHLSGGDLADVRSLSMSYTRQNAGAELNWHPTRQWNVGVAYGWERYDRRLQDVDVTNENSGKIYADWKPKNYITVRASWAYSARRYGTYDYTDFVQAVQWPAATPDAPQIYSTAYRQFFLDNRNRNIGKFSVAVDVTPNLRITPTGGWQDVDYNLNQATELGVLNKRSWNAGVEAAYAVSPATRFLFSYMREHRSQLVASVADQALPFSADNYYTANVEDNVNTFIVRADHTLIPNKLDLSLGYTYSSAVNSQPINFADGHTPDGGQFPDVKNTFQRLDAILRYKFDENQVRQLGWKGNVTAKLRYAWERNSVANWQNDLMQNYMQPTDASAGYMVWLAGNNPNYDVQLIAASLAFTW
jgi:MtrB/PioB family decaheme-associated outer membrane protein